MKITAVLTDTLYSFHTWCKIRRIKEIKRGRYVDFENKLYIPITRFDDVIGKHFTDYEEINSIYAKDHHELIIAIKHRINQSNHS